MIKSLVLNLQPLLKKDSLFEILLESNETNKTVAPNRMAFDMSPFFNDKQIEFSDTRSTFCRSFFGQDHGNDNVNKADDTKILYQKTPQNPRAFLTSAVNEIKITEEDQIGIWALEFKVIRDSLYDTTKIEGLSKQTDPKNSFSECDGHVASSQFVSDILDNKAAIFNGGVVFNSDSIAEGGEYTKYALNYDWIKIVFYGASIASDFGKTYTKNELYGTKTALITELVDGGQYFLKNSKNEYIEGTDANGDDIKKIFIFNKNAETFTHNDETYKYNGAEDLFIMQNLIKAVIDNNGAILRDAYYQFETLDLKNQSILIDANGKTLQLDPKKAKYVTEEMKEIPDTYTIEDTKTIENLILSALSTSTKYKPTKRNNIVDFTQDFLNISSNNNQAADLINSGIMFEDNFSKILINFDFSKIENDISNSGANSYSHTDTNGNKRYYYPNATNIEDEEVKQAVSIKKAEDVKGGEIDGPSIIFDNGLRNDENSYVRDFVMFGHLFVYFSRIEEQVSITETDENIRENNKISLFEERRINPLLWHYIDFIWSTNRLNENSVDLEPYLVQLLDPQNVQSDQIGVNLTGSNPGGTSYFDFVNLNYYKLSQETRDKHEQLIFDGATFPKLITKHSLANPKSTRYYNEDNKEIVRAVVALSQYIDDMELGKKVIQTIVKLTRQMN